MPIVKMFIHFIPPTQDLVKDSQFDSAVLRFDFDGDRVMHGPWQCIEGALPPEIPEGSSGTFDKNWQSEGHFNWRLTNGQYHLDMLRAPEGPADPYHKSGDYNAPGRDRPGSWTVQKRHR